MPTLIYIPKLLIVQWVFVCEYYFVLLGFLFMSVCVGFPDADTNLHTKIFHRSMGVIYADIFSSIGFLFMRAYIGFRETDSVFKRWWCLVFKSAPSELCYNILKAKRINHEHK